MPTQTTNGTPGNPLAAPPGRSTDPAARQGSDGGLSRAVLRRCARPPRPARSAAAPSRVAPRVLPSPGEGLPPVDGIAAVCRAALGGATVGSAIPLRERAWLRTAARVV